jgi:hypothetical protein
MRVKARIADLEKEVEMLREELIKKEERILELNSALERARDRVEELLGLTSRSRCEAEEGGSSKPLNDEQQQHLNGGVSLVLTTGELYVEVGRHMNPIDSNPPANLSCNAENKLCPILPEQRIPCCTPSPSSSTTPTSESQTYIRTLSLTNQAQLPTPAPLESTTPCSEAYVLIDQQNFRSVDVDAIYTLLARGFRKGIRHGDGCRVENGRLFGVLDFISGV